MFFVSLLARRWIKNFLAPVVSSSLYRQLYFLVSTLAIALVPYGWAPLPHLLWHLESPALRYILNGKQFQNVHTTYIYTCTYCLHIICVHNYVLMEKCASLLQLPHGEVFFLSLDIPVAVLSHQPGSVELVS